MGGLNYEDIAVGVFTSALNLRERALSVQNTWLRSFPKAFLIGGWKYDPGLRMISLGPEVGEDYHSAHRKQFLGLLELRRRFPDAAWFFLTGCDAYVFPERLKDLLEGFDPRRELLVGGHCGSALIDGERVIYPAGGPGFALSGTLVEALAPLIPRFIDDWERRQPGYASACDLAMAVLAKKSRGVKLSYSEGFYHCPPYHYPGNPYLDGEGRSIDRAVCARPIAFHMLHIREMYLLSRGKELKRPGHLLRIFDKASRYISRKLHSRSLVNRTMELLYPGSPGARTNNVQ